MRNAWKAESSPGSVSFTYEPFGDHPGGEYCVEREYNWYDPEGRLPAVRTVFGKRPVGNSARRRLPPGGSCSQYGYRFDAPRRSLGRSSAGCSSQPGEARRGQPIAAP
jgi:hypothetical protein